MEDEVYYVTIEYKSIDVADVDSPKMLISVPVVSIMTSKMRNIFLLHWKSITEELAQARRLNKERYSNYIHLDCEDVTVAVDMDYIHEHIAQAKKIPLSELKILLTYFKYSKYFRPVDSLMEKIHDYHTEIALSDALNTEENDVCKVRGTLLRLEKEKE